MEAPESVWLDPETGEELSSGLFADIYHPVRPAFREYAVFFHDELEIKDKDGNQPVDRTMMPADKPRNVGFVIHGNRWKEQPKDPYSRTVPMQGAVSIGNTFEMDLGDGPCCPGDYLYRSGSLKWDVESGMWGILRVMKQGLGCKCKNVCRKLLSCTVCRERNGK